MNDIRKALRECKGQVLHVMQGLATSVAKVDIAVHQHAESQVGLVRRLLEDVEQLLPHGDGPKAGSESSVIQHLQNELQVRVLPPPPTSWHGRVRCTETHIPPTPPHPCPLCVCHSPRG